VNLGEESQKSGIDLKDLHNFYNYCTNDLQLDIIGLMCLPPLNLKELSMGMSSDFEKAIINGSTYLRLGTAILGERNVK
jgi:uncharacterized pyridoxal phosphate-containing UPF0001 family protein